MKEIKSFREYILEKSLLSEDDNENSSTDEEKKDSDEFVPTSPALDVVTNFTLKLSNGSPDNVRQQLNTKFEQLKKTFDSLDDIITAKQLNNVNSIQDKKQKAAINILGGSETFTSVRDAWLDEWNKMIKSRRDNKQKVSDIETIRKKAFTQGQRDKADEAYQRLTKEDLDEDVLNEGPINIMKAFGDWTNRKLSTGSQLSTGQNRFSAPSVLTTAKERSKEGVYDAGEDSSKSSFANKMYSNFVADARAIIAKDKKLGMSYLTAAGKKLKRYNNPNYFIKGTDSAFAEEISRDLYRANSTLESIGYRLRQLLTGYKDSLNKLSKEIEISDAKNQEALTSTNAKKAKDRYELKKATFDKKQKEREEKEAEEKKQADLENTREQERKNKINTAYSILRDYAFEDFDKYTPEGSEYYGTDRLAKLGNKIIEEIKSSSSKIWRTTDSENKGNLFKQKQARALAFYVLVSNLDKIKKLCNNSVYFENQKKELFNKWLEQAFEKVGELNNSRVITLAKNKLPRENSFLKDTSKKVATVAKKLGKSLIKDKKTEEPAEPGTGTDGAKDFKDSEPAAPANIYDYALQKAKRN